MDSTNQVQTIDEAVCILLYAHSLRKGMNHLLPSSFGQIEGQTVLFR